MNWVLHQLQCQRENLPDNSSDFTGTQTLITTTHPHLPVFARQLCYFAGCVYIYKSREPEIGGQNGRFRNATTYGRVKCVGLQLWCWQSHWWGIIYAPAAWTHKSHKRLLIMTAARPSWPQMQHFIKGMTQMSRTSHMSTPRHPEERARLRANSGFKISIDGLMRGSHECEAENKLR